MCPCCSRTGEVEWNRITACLYLQGIRTETKERVDVQRLYMCGVTLWQFEKHQSPLSCCFAELCTVDAGALSSGSLRVKQVEVYFQNGLAMLTCVCRRGHRSGPSCSTVKFVYVMKNIQFHGDGVWFFRKKKKKFEPWKYVPLLLCCCTIVADCCSPSLGLFELLLRMRFDLTTNQ